MRKHIFFSVLSAFLAFILSCTNIFTDNSSSENSGKARVSFSCSVDSRQIAPSNMTESDIARIQLTAQIKDSASGEYAEYPLEEKPSKSWDSLSSLEKASIELEPGIYTFTLELYTLVSDKERLTQKALLSDVEISLGENSLIFNAKYVESGSLSLKFHWDLESMGEDGAESVSRIDRVGVSLYKISTNGTIGEELSDFSEECDYSIVEIEDTTASDGKKSVCEGIYSPSEELENGSYFIIFSLYDSQEPDSILNTITDIVKIKGFKTEETIEFDLDNINRHVEPEPEGGFFYISGSGDDENGDGSEESPFKTLETACQKIAEARNPGDWTIFVSGTISGLQQVIPESFTTSNANSLSIKGASGLDSDGLPQDAFDMGKSESVNAVTNGTCLVISTSVPVTITNLKITGGYGSSTMGGGINISENSIVSLGDGVLVIKNRGGSSNSCGGGIRNEGTLYVYGSAVIGDKSNGGKTDESEYTYAADSSSANDFKNNKMANWAKAGGGIYNGSEASGSTVSAKLYLGYSLNNDGNLEEEELTGGIYYNGGAGGAIYNAAGSIVYFDSGTLAWNGTTSEGGAIKNAAGGRIEMTGGSILNNRSYEAGNYTSYGGGVSNVSATSIFIMSGGVMNKNVSANDKGYGGAVYNCGKFFMCGSAVIGDSEAESVANADLYGNMAQRGGAIYNYVNTASSKNGEVYIGYTADENGNPEEKELTGGIYYNYSKHSGTEVYGGGAIGSEGTLKIASGTIAYNASEDYGGAIWSSKVFEMTGGIIHSNVAEVGGGAVACFGSARSGGFSMSASALIPAGEDGKNDVYLKDSNKIDITGPLDGDSDNPIKATITPETYTEGTIILTASGAVLKYEYDSFAVTQPEGDGVGIWKILEDGTLAKVITYQEAEWSDGELSYTTKNQSSFTPVTSDTVEWNAGWYVVSGEVEINNRITINGDVNLILCDAAKLTAKSGITLPFDKCLTIYAQEEGTGELHALCSEPYDDEGNELPQGAGIGALYSREMESGMGSNLSGGTVIIHGGNITANGGAEAAGIGSAGEIDTYNSEGSEGRVSGGTVTIYGGELTAHGGSGAAGIGGRGIGATFTMYGGSVSATSESYGAGIGGGFGGDGGIVKIYGGALTSEGADGGAGIGGGGSSGTGGKGGTVEIYGGSVTAVGGIGGGNGNSDHGTLTLGENMTIKAGNDSQSLTETTVEEYMANHTSYVEIAR